MLNLEFVGTQPACHTQPAFTRCPAYRWGKPHLVSFNKTVIGIATLHARGSFSKPLSSASRRTNPSPGVSGCAAISCPAGLGVQRSFHRRKGSSKYLRER